MRWQDGRMVRQKGGRCLVLFKGGAHKMNPRFHLFVSDVNQGKEGVGWVQDFFVWLQGWKDFLDLSRTVKNIVGCGSVWNL